MTPVTVIGGYLGAGKTTLVNHALRNAAGRRLAVLVNEFGALAIDEDLIEAEGEDIISIAGGCICCAFGDDLVGALITLSERDPKPDHILIEASGVAIPASVAASLSLLADFRLNGIVVLVDAETIRGNATDKYLGDTILRQLQDADLVIMSKTDLITDASARAVTAWLENLARNARIMSARHGDIPAEILLGPTSAETDMRAAGHAAADFESAVFECDIPQDPQKLSSSLTRGDLGVLRAKGFVRDLSGDSRLLQVVGRRCEISVVAPVKDHKVVCIGLSGGLQTAKLARLFSPD